ncbi:MAG: hypothetical protein U5J83_15765 [Bryobacterales bacterium]|nr:hypothetical protein [Bryobacterales bacterium]
MIARLLPTQRRKSVIIKPNLVSTNRQLAATHADALRGILDYLDTRWRGPVYIAESSAGIPSRATGELQVLAGGRRV